MIEPTVKKPGSRPVPFFVEARSARDVRVTGDFSDWTLKGIQLSNDDHGKWRTLLSLPPGVYEYRLLIDGLWADHPEAHKRVPNPFGSQNCVMVVI
jgi:1,4-alpha-glucan branching enzyme